MRRAELELWEGIARHSGCCFYGAALSRPRAHLVCLPAAHFLPSLSIRLFLQKPNLLHRLRQVLIHSQLNCIVLSNFSPRKSTTEHGEG